VETSDLWQALESCRISAKQSCSRAADAIEELDANAERRYKTELVGIFNTIRTTLERLQTRDPQDSRLRDALDRFGQLPQPLRIADAQRMLARLEELSQGPKRSRRIDPFPTLPHTRWEDITIVFTSEFQVQISAGDQTQTRNYDEMGFADTRGAGSKPNRAWFILKQLADHGGRIPRPRELTGPGLTALEKRIQSIRRKMRELFQIPGDPFKSFRPNYVYEARFKVYADRSSS
jgi:hypothetical protein